MGAPGTSRAIALLCNAQGIVEKVLRDDFALENVRPGRPFPALAARDYFQRALSFLAEVQAQMAAFDSEIALEGGEDALYFTGGRIDEWVLVVGGTGMTSSRSFYEELIRINNEQVNQLRAAIKGPVPGLRGDEIHLNELTRLNNELANAQRELVKKNAELERLNEQKNQFLGMAAHDLRNPLGVIKGYCEYLLEEIEDDPGRAEGEFAELLTSMRDSSQFMLNMVNDLLDISRIEAGRLKLDLEEVDLAELVERNLTRNRMLAERKQIEVRCAFLGRVPPMLLDFGKIEQVLNNLVSNAIKYSHPGTRVEVRAVAQEDGVVLEVADQGQGIPAAELDKLFRPFQTTSVRSTGGEQSTGLGLVIARRIVEGHGGRIWVDSEVGRGSIFYVALPFRRAGDVCG